MWNNVGFCCTLGPGYLLDGVLGTWECKICKDGGVLPHLPVTKGRWNKLCLALVMVSSNWELFDFLQNMRVSEHIETVNEWTVSQVGCEELICKTIQILQFLYIFFHMRLFIRHQANILLCSALVFFFLVCFVIWLFLYVLNSYQSRPDSCSFKNREKQLLYEPEVQLLWKKLWSMW